VIASSDIVVVGSGIIGCAIAYELGRRGASVLVLDDRTPGMGATQASAGMLAPYNEVDEEGPHLELTVRSLELFDGFMAQLGADTSLSVPYRRTGTLTLALDDAAHRRLERTANWLEGRGVAAAVLDRTAVLSEEPCASPNTRAGLLLHQHGYVGATALTAALVSAATSRRVQFCRSARPHSIRPQGSGVVIASESAQVSAAHAIVAAGSWSGQIHVEGATGPAPVHPVRGQLLQLKASGANLRRVTWGDRAYLVPWDDGSVLVGATVEHVGYDERTTVDGMRDLLDGVAKTLAPGWPATILSARAGLRPGTPDGLPIVGASAGLPAVMYATGHYRNGVLMAPLTARLVADVLLERRVDPLMQVMSPARFGGL
jgi:glycine oxidase